MKLLVTEIIGILSILYMSIHYDCVSSFYFIFSIRYFLFNEFEQFKKGVNYGMSCLWWSIRPR